jgi:hypothetical protein
MEISIRFLSASSLEKVSLFLSIIYFFFCHIREQETIDVERKLRYEFMFERCRQEMPEERKYNS